MSTCAFAGNNVPCYRKENTFIMNIPIKSNELINIYLEGKGKFAEKKSDTEWAIWWKEDQPAVEVTINSDHVVFECKNSSGEEFYATEFRNFRNIKPIYIK